MISNFISHRRVSRSFFRRFAKTRERNQSWERAFTFRTAICLNHPLNRYRTSFRTRKSFQQTGNCSSTATLSCALQRGLLFKFGLNKQPWKRSRFRFEFSERSQNFQRRNSREIAPLAEKGILEKGIRNRYRNWSEVAKLASVS